MFYEDPDQALPLLAEEIAKIPALLDDVVTSEASPNTTSDDAVAAHEHDERSTDASYEIKSRTTPPIETEPTREPTVLVSSLVSGSGHGAGASSDSLMISAEEE